MKQVTGVMAAADNNSIGDFAGRVRRAEGAEQPEPAGKALIKVAALKGPTGIGMVN